MAETWRSVVGYEGFAEVSDHGRVRSLPRSQTMQVGSGRWSYERTYRVAPGRVLKPKTKSNGYQEVGLWLLGKQQFRYVHRLVLEAFVGLPGIGFQAGHLNGNRSDNRAANLMWVTPTVNASHRALHGTNKIQKEKTQLRHQAAKALLTAGFSPAQVSALLALRPSSVAALAASV